ncbi:hypothetical protein HYALB_00012745 [Hymenoscyphus albidus]|uniref:Uncharacterized protein n=1 Tax=Hymenoscyphus albidus TaxID=595503 RepID=A0A9N9LTB0_9HELO|nr:hypothetical protein HYALB_00012745 [Hymenoscyphus albidus]
MPKKKQPTKKPEALKTPPQETSFLIKASIEIRLMIFDYLVPTDGSVEIYTPFRKVVIVACYRDVV